VIYRVHILIKRYDTGVYILKDLYTRKLHTKTNK